MLGNPRNPWQISVPPYVKIAILVLLTAALFAAVYLSRSMQPAPVAEPLPPVEVAVPLLDRALLAEARDGAREHRLIIEPKPFEHLLEKAIDVSPAKAQALGMPEHPMPLALLRADPARCRSSWLWYKGVLEDLTGPRQGHPVLGFQIYEATVRLADGEHVFAAFSEPPGEQVQKDTWVRVEGYLLKLRDTTWPRDVREAPMLVGRRIQHDYEDWGPVREFDPALLADIDDVDPYPGAPLWHDVEEDQGVPLWHLAAFARDTAGEHTLADWRKQPVLNALEIHEKLVDDEVPRGTRIRVLGMLRQLRVVAAEPNPAGIAYWSKAYVQCKDYGSHIVPIWVPKNRLDLPLGSDVEVRGYFYRWWAYESIEKIKLRVPLFVAADLDICKLEIDEPMRALSYLIGIWIVLLIVVIGIAQWRAGRSSRRHAAEMDARRRRRRERAAAAP